MQALHTAQFVILYVGISHKNKTKKKHFYYHFDIIRVQCECSNLLTQAPKKYTTHALQTESMHGPGVRHKR